MQPQLQKGLQRLEAVHREYLALTRDLGPEQLNRKPAPDQWSAGQVLYHLLNVLQATHSFMSKRIAEKKVNNPAGMKNQLRSILLRVALASPLKFKAPRAAGEIPAQVDYAATAAGIEKSIGELRQLLESLPREYEDKELFKHPRAGYINAAQTLDFLVDHARHHRAQLESLVRETR